MDPSASQPQHKGHGQGHAQGHKVDKGEREKGPPKKFQVKKRQPPRALPQKPNHLYISDKSNFKAQIAKCQKLIEGGDHSEIFLHGLGSAIPRAVNVALELKQLHQGTIDYVVNTSTVQLIDDLIPLDDSTPPSHQTRKVSCVDIRIFRAVKIP